MLRFLTIALTFCGLVFFAGNVEAQTKKTITIKRLFTGAADRLAMKGVEQAGLLHCPKGQKCYCVRPTKDSGYQSTCKYVDKGGVYTDVQQYNDAKACLILCLGKTVEQAKENVDIKGKEEKPETPGTSQTSATPGANDNCEKLPNMRGDIVSCCGSKGTMNGVRTCLNEKATQR